MFELYSVPSFDTGHPETVPGKAIGSAKQRVEPGDVLICKINPRINRVWVVGDSSDHQQIGSTEWIRFPKSEEVLPEFLAYHLRRESVRAHLVINASGVGGSLMRVKPATLANEEIPLPTIETQRRIVARIDELFSELDDGEEELARARADLETYRKALLKAAVTGELTADWRATTDIQETGSELVRSIAAARGTTPVLAEGAKLPEGWAITTIGQLFRVFVGATPSRKEPSFWGGEIPWVSSGEVSFCRIRSTRETISNTALRGSAERVHPPGTVMLGMIGEGKTRGQAAILDISAAHNQNCASIRVSETPIPPEFVYHALRERYEETRNASSGGNQPALNKGRVEAMKLPIPPLQECREIVRLLDDSDLEADALEGAISSMQMDTATLRQSILAAAFRGELVQ